MRQTMSIVIISVVVSLYVNMDLVSANFVTLHKIDEGSRASHAVELLGREYHHSGAREATDDKSLNEKIYQQFRDRLPEAYQDQALDFTNIVIEEAHKAKIDPVLVMAIISVESQFDPKAKGTSGEMGLMQILPNTAAWIAKKTGHSYKSGESLYDPQINIVLGVRYIAFLRKSFGGHGARYIAAYNMGAGNVRKLVAQNTNPKVYPAKVMYNYKKLYTGFVKTDDAVSTFNWQVAAD